MKGDKKMPNSGFYPIIFFSESAARGFMTELKEWMDDEMRKTLDQNEKQLEKETAVRILYRQFEIEGSEL